MTSLNTNQALPVTLRRRTVTLPMPVNARNKTRFGVAAYIFAATLYLSSNHFAWFTPHYLTLTTLDKAIPFLPTTIWVYLTEYFLFITAYHFCEDTLLVNQYLIAMLCKQTLSVMIFVLWPTIYPRTYFPLPPHVHSITLQVFSAFRHLDGPTNCLPSLHVSSCYLSAFIFLQAHKTKFWLFFIWATLISISTLTTKQHYVVDVITGMLLAFSFHLLFQRHFRYRTALAS